MNDKQIAEKIKNLHKECHEDTLMCTGQNWNVLNEERFFNGIQALISEAVKAEREKIIADLDRFAEKYRPTEFEPDCGYMQDGCYAALEYLKRSTNGTEQAETEQSSGGEVS
jgi:hypothetical protein